MVWGGRREEGSGWGTHVYLWQIHSDIWENQYNIVKLKNKIKKNSQSRLKLGKKQTNATPQLFLTFSGNLPTTHLDSMSLSWGE